jgi:hypothetical protein
MKRVIASEGLTTFGRLIFAAALALFGCQYLVYGMRRAPIPGPPWPSINPTWTFVPAAVFLVSALCVAGPARFRKGSFLTGLVFYLYCLVVYLPPLFKNIHNPGPWTSGFEVVAISAVCIVLAEVSYPSHIAISVAQYTYAASLFVFGIQHFIYAHFIAGLVPRWIPGRLFWAYFVGCAFVAAGASIALRRKVIVSASLLGLMFLLWVFVVHLPRVVNSPFDGNEWSSGLVALAMSGGAFVFAGGWLSSEKSEGRA